MRKGDGTLKAVIMAGGEGARLRPLTCDLPKPMVPIMSRPMMEYIVELLAEHGIKEMAVTLQYLPEKIKKHFGNGDEFGVQITYFLEDEPLGTAGSVKNAASFLDETFLVISGDCLTDINLTEAIDFHRQCRSMATIVLNPQENPLEYGIVVVDDKGWITRFLEKPRWGEVFSDTVNTGIYILEPEVLEFIPPKTNYDFSKNLFPLLLEQGKPMFGKVVDNYWCDIGSVEQYRQAHYDVLDGKVKLNLEAEKKDGIWISAGVEIHAESRVHSPAFLGKGTRIGYDAEVGPYSCLGADNYLSGRASIKKGVTWSGVYLGKKSVVRGGVLGAKTVLKEKAEVFEGAVVGSDSLVEAQATVRPGVRIWPYKVVESGATVQDNLIWSERANRNLFGTNGVKCLANVDLTMENMVRLGSSFASTQGVGSYILTGSDGHSCSNLLKSALVVGLQACGSHVLDIEETLAPVVRMALAGSDALAGVYISQTGEEGGSKICFYDCDGLVISQSQERKIEQIYWRNDFPRSGNVDLGKVYPDRVWRERYREALLKEAPLESIKNKGFSLFWLAPSPALLGLFHPILLQLNCQVTVWYSEELGSLSLEEDGRSGKRVVQQELKRAFKAGKYDLGFYLEPDGEAIKLIDERGQLFPEELYQALLTTLLLQEEDTKKLVLPLSSSRVHEEMAGQKQVGILHSKSSPRDLQEKIREVNRASGKSASFHPTGFLQVDCVAALLRLLGYLSGQDDSLSRMIEKVPGIHLKQKEVFCPWNEKGRVMRRLSQELPGDALWVEMTDGIKVFHPEGWALVLPDPEKPSYRVYSEGFTEEIADSLSDFYADRVKDYRADNRADK